MLDRAGAQKQQSFENAVVENVEKSGGKADDGEQRHRFGEPQHADPDAEQNDPDILDAVIGEQALEIMLRQGEQHAEHPARPAHGDQQPAPPWLGRPENGQDPDQPVNADLDHRSRHQCRGMAGRDRVRFRQPDMRRDDAGLCAKADQGQNEHGGTERLMVLQSSAISGEVGGSSNPTEQHEQNQQERRAQMRRREISPGGMSHRRLPVVENDQKERAQRHDFPRQKKQQTVMRGDHQRHARGQHVQMEPACRRCEPAAAAGKIAAAV